MLETSRIRDQAGYYGVGLATAIAAAGAAYFLDAQSGGRRRARVRDQVHRTANWSRDFAGKVGRDARQRTRGLYATSASRFHRDDADDRIIEERVRAELGRLTAHPGAIEVDCSNGVVRLRGDVLRNEAGPMLRGVERVRGVHDVINETRAHEDARNVPALQGGNSMRRPSPHFEYFQTNWSPAPRALAGVGGFGMIVTGIGRGTPVGYGLAAGGAALLARSICNKPLSQIAKNIPRERTALMAGL